MKQVKCISPHGGCHNGMRTNGNPVFPLPIYGADENGNKILIDSYLPEVAPEDLLLPPNPGGYIDDGRIPGRFAAVGQVYDVPDNFYANGFHWSELDADGNETGATKEKPAEAAPPPPAPQPVSTPAPGTAGESE